MSKPTIIITETLDPVCAAWLEERANVIWHMHDQPGVEDVLATIDGAVVRTYTQVNDAFMDLAPHCKVIGRAGVGVGARRFRFLRQEPQRLSRLPRAKERAHLHGVRLLDGGSGRARARV